MSEWLERKGVIVKYHKLLLEDHVYVGTQV